MCFGGGGTPDPPPPPPLPAPPPPPVAPPAPLPPPDVLETEVNPAVERRDESKKDPGQQATGTSDLRIETDPRLNTGAAPGSGGINV